MDGLTSNYSLPFVLVDSVSVCLPPFSEGCFKDKR